MTGNSQEVMGWNGWYRRKKRFPFVEIRPTTGNISLFLAGSILACYLVGFLLGFMTVNQALSISFLTTVISIATLFFNSPGLRAIPWVILPGFVGAEIHTFLTVELNLPIFLRHIPLNLLVAYHIVSLFFYRRPKWWMIPAVGLGWMVFYLLLKWLDPHKSSPIPK